MPRPLAPSRKLVRFLEESATPIAAIDAERKVVFVSRKLAEWLGVEAEQLVGVRCAYQAAADDGMAAIAAGLCPPPEAFEGKVDSGCISRPASGDRPFEERPARYVHLAGPSDEDALLLVIAATPGAQSAATCGLDPRRLHASLMELRSKLGSRFHISQLIGVSDAIARVREQVRIAAREGTRVLVVGPTGSGREHVARTIHYGQVAAAVGALMPIACELVDAEQMQAALASVLRRQAEAPVERPGAALLLNVDRLRPDAQQELAGFLQLPGIELRTLATARAPLLRLAVRGKFRRDLAYALSTLTISVPPLRSRQEDIPLLAQHFLEEANTDGGRQLSGFRPAAMELLVGWTWPRNVDELAQAVREAREKAEGTQIAASDLPPWIHLANRAAAYAPREVESIQLDEYLAEIEREILSRSLRAARGNKSKAAQLLGITRPRLLRRLAQLGLIAAPAADAEEPVVFEPLSEEPT
jgi:transcriptional regulator with PAS, ATPase and Fis domain